MESRAKLFGHPIHQMLVIFPAGLLATSVAFDIAYHVADNTALANVAHYLILAGIVGAALMAVTAWMGGELVDRLGIGICDETGLNAPSTLRRSLRSQPARGH